MGIFGIGGKKRKEDNGEQTRIVYTAEVVGIDDKDDAGRIIVRIPGIDNELNESEGKGAFPLLPKTNQIFPKIGESVFIIMEFLGNDTYNRYWVGPIISQPQKIGYDSNFKTAKAGLSEGSNFGLSVAPSTITESKGVYPDKEFVAQIGRENTDIIHKKNEILIRTGKHIDGNNLIFNKKNPGYIQIKSHVTLPPLSEKEKETIGSVTTIVSNRINLITHDGSPNFSVTDPENQITNESLQKIIKEAHPLVFGDTLIRLIKVQRAFALNHIHEQINMSPNNGQPEYKDLMNFPLDKILSKTIHIN